MGEKSVEERENGYIAHTRGHGSNRPKSQHLQNHADPKPKFYTPRNSEPETRIRKPSTDESLVRGDRLFGAVIQVCLYNFNRVLGQTASGNVGAFPIGMGCFGSIIEKLQ